ncbi:MAG: class I SAM-dependent methyltransferase [Thermoanaerobaculia bacterium]
MSDGTPHVCPWWLAYSFDNPLRRLVHSPEAMLGAWVRPGARVVDIGCGMGYFSIGMAELVGPTGRVTSIDLQQRMLDVLAKRAAKRGVLDRIDRIKADEDDLHLTGAADFVLAFWMVHEVPDQLRLFEQVARILVSGGSMLVVEPKGHVSEETLAGEIAIAESAGFMVVERPRVRLSRSVLLQRSA